jgi:glycosyltransferase involved in cell wall biosynthesis
MRAIHVIAGLQNPAAGTSYSILKLAEGLKRVAVAGQVHTLEPVPARAVAMGVVVGYPVSQGIPRLGVSRAMRRGLICTTGDILHNHGVWLMPNIYAGLAARRRHIPLVFAPRGMFSERAMAFSRLRKRFSWWCLGQRGAVRTAACFHATSESEAQDIRRLGLRQPIAVIPNGIDLPNPEAETQASQPKGRRRILFVSRIHPIKGLPILLRAWQGVERRYADWELVVAGPDEGGHLSQVQALAGELGLQRVSFPGPAYGDAKSALYRSADLFVLPTHSENFGMAIAEALAYAVPVITTTGAPWAGLEERGCGWWIELSEGNLAEALQSAMDLPHERRVEMGRRGRLWMEQSFGWDRIAKEMKSVYEWVLGDGPPPACVVTD